MRNHKVKQVGSGYILSNVLANAWIIKIHGPAGHSIRSDLPLQAAFAPKFIDIGTLSAKQDMSPLHKT